MCEPVSWPAAVDLSLVSKSWAILRSNSSHLQRVSKWKTVFSTSGLWLTWWACRACRMDSSVRSRCTARRSFAARCPCWRPHADRWSAETWRRSVFGSSSGESCLSPLIRCPYRRSGLYALEWFAAPQWRTSSGTSKPWRSSRWCSGVADRI